MYDQIYWTLTFGNTVHVDPVSLCPEMKDYTIFIDGISKSFAATGVRVGWAFGPQRIIDKMKSILSHVGAWSPKAEQVATAKYLMNESAVDSYLTAFKNEVNQRLIAFYNGLKEIKNQGFQVDVIAPEAAIYLTVSFNLIGKATSDGKILATTADVTAYLLDEAKIAIVPFNAFGASKDSTWYRISVGTSVLSEIDALFAQLKSALIKLK